MTTEPADDIGEIVNPQGTEEAAGAPAAIDAATVSAGTVGHRPRKRIDPSALKRMAAAVAKAKQDEDGLAPEDEAGELVETGKPAPVGTATTPTAAPAAPAPTTDAGPDPERIALFEQVNLRRADLDKREAAVRAAEDRHRDQAAGFVKDPYKALEAMVRSDLGEDASADEIKEELSYLITSLSLTHAGATIDPANQAHDIRKLKRELRLSNAEKRKAAQAARKQTEETEKSTRTAEAIAAVGQEFQAVASNYPWLANTEAPADLLWEVIKGEHDRTGRIMEIAEAAKVADEHIKKETTAYFTKYQRLLAPPPPAVSTPPSAPQGDPPNRRSRTLSNVDASESDSLPSNGSTVRLSREERRKATFQKWGPKLRDTET